ncbi:hypothetical protein AAVH_09179 [Aphelenchoides avenae]|nr:hypothetical protein AAVH_09179 [Aphelenchus avenae]
MDFGELPEHVLRERLIRLRTADLNALIAAYPALQRFMDNRAFRIARCYAGHFGAHGTFHDDEEDNGPLDIHCAHSSV